MTKRERTVIEDLIEAVGGLRATFEAQAKAEDRYLHEHREMHAAMNSRIDALVDAVDDLQRTRDRAKGALWGWGVVFMAATTVLSVIAALIGKSWG